jgi:nucleosome binding factor SPN SPT16 subunit
LFYKSKLVNEVNKVFEASVEMVFCTQTHNMLEVSVINVSINSEQSLEDHFNDADEVFRKWNANLTWKDLLTIQLIFHPGHQEVYVFLS